MGPPGSHLGCSIYLRELFGREDGAPPPVDLALEKLTGDLVRGLQGQRVAAGAEQEGEQALVGQRGDDVAAGLLDSGVWSAASGGPWVLRGD